MIDFWWSKGQLARAGRELCLSGMVLAVTAVGIMCSQYRTAPAIATVVAAVVTGAAIATYLRMAVVLALFAVITLLVFLPPGVALVVAAVTTVSACSVAFHLADEGAER